MLLKKHLVKPQLKINKELPRLRPLLLLLLIKLKLPLMLLLRRPPVPSMEPSKPLTKPLIKLPRPQLKLTKPSQLKRKNTKKNTRRSQPPPKPRIPIDQISFVKLNYI